MPTAEGAGAAKRLEASDPVVVRRGRIGRAAKAAKRVGYLALMIAIVAFGVGVVVGFSPGLVRVAVFGLVASCVILPVPIVISYGVRAADREERAAAAARPASRGAPRGQAE